MAITIQKNFTQNKFYPSQNPINCTVSSNNSGKCNFRYICDVYINGTKVFTDKLFPDPITGYAFFQISRILQDYIKTSIPKSQYTDLINIASSTQVPAAAFQVQCKFGEEYDSTTTCDGNILQYVNLANSNTFYVYESAFDYEDFPSYDQSNFVLGTNSQVQFLTNSQREIEVTYNDSYYLDFITPNVISPSYVLNLKTYDTAGNVIGTATFSKTLSNVRRYRLAVGPFDVNSYFSQPVINTNISKYDIYMTFGATQITETFTFKVKAPKTYMTRLGFIGLKGSIEHFTFYHRNKENYTIDRRNFEKVMQSNYSGDWKYEVGDRGTTTYKVSAKESHTVTTYCDQQTSEWLYEMWLSPYVWTYRRPTLYSFRPFQDGSYVKFWVDGEHNFKVGDDIWGFANKTAFNDAFTVTSVSGNIVDCNLLYSVWGADLPACGYLHKAESWQMLPVVISDNQIERKQRTARPIEYSLNYAMAYQKNTLRG